jgi:hypothetical protein
VTTDQRYKPEKRAGMIDFLTLSFSTTQSRQRRVAMILIDRVKIDGVPIRMRVEE